MTNPIAPKRTPRHPFASRPPGEWAPLAVLICGTFMYVLDSFVVNVALPSVQHGLYASAPDIEWVVAGYAVTIAAALVLGGRLGDLIGRRRTFLIGAGQGLCITPLTATVLSHARPATAGAVSGALSTMQQVGNSIGVAVIGMVFFDASAHGYGVAYGGSTAATLVLLVAVAALTRLLPRTGDAAVGRPAGVGLPSKTWRRIEAQARAAHDAETLLAARDLTAVLDATVDRSTAGLLRLRGTAWQLSLAGTVAPASFHGQACRLAAAGRYGRFWWIRLIVGGRSVTVAGSHLRVTPLRDGGADGPLDSPTGGELILASCERGSRSVTSPE